MLSIDKPGDLRKVFGGDDKSLAIFLLNMKKFDQCFCNMMAAGVDFTLRFEVRGNKGELIHCRVQEDGFDRPPGVEKRVGDKSR